VLRGATGPRSGNLVAGACYSHSSRPNSVCGASVAGARYNHLVHPYASDYRPDALDSIAGLNSAERTELEMLNASPGCQVIVPLIAYQGKPLAE
jgi:hypothetical protein